MAMHKTHRAEETLVTLIGTDLPKISAKACEEQEGNLRQPMQLHQGQVSPDQPSGIPCWTDYIDGQGKTCGYHLPGFL